MLFGIGEGAQPAPMDPTLEAARPTLAPVGNESVLQNPTPAEKALQPYPTPQERVDLDKQTERSTITSPASEQSEDWTSLDVKREPTTAPETTADEPVQPVDKLPNLTKRIEQIAEQTRQRISQIEAQVASEQEERKKLMEKLRGIEGARRNTEGIATLAELGIITVQDGEAVPMQMAEQPSTSTLSVQEAPIPQPPLAKAS